MAVSTLEDPSKPILFSMARLDRVKNLTGLAEWCGRGEGAGTAALRARWSGLDGCLPRMQGRSLQGGTLVGPLLLAPAPGTAGASGCASCATW